MLNIFNNDNILLNVWRVENFWVNFFIVILLFIIILFYLNVFYKLGKGNVVYESNIFEIKLYVYIKFF